MASSIARATIPPTSQIERSADYHAVWKPEFKEILLSLSPIDKVYLLYFYTPLQLSTADRAIVINYYDTTTAPTYPNPPTPTGTDATLSASDIAFHNIAIEKFERKQSKVIDIAVAKHIIKKVLLNSIPKHLRPILFAGQPDFASSLNNKEILTVIDRYFANPTQTDRLATTLKLSTVFTYVDDTSYDHHISRFMTNTAALRFMSTPMCAAVEIATLRDTFLASAEHSAFRFHIDLFEANNQDVATVTLESFIIACRAAVPSIINRHSSPVAAYDFAANSAAKSTRPNPNYKGSKPASSAPAISSHRAAVSPAAPTGTRLPKMRYCYTHGTNYLHSSARCPEPKAGHQTTCHYFNYKDFPGATPPDN